MTLFLRLVIPVAIILLSGRLVSGGPVFGQESTVRSTAVVDLSFDDEEAAEDRSTAGTATNTAQPKNGVSRFRSPFWNVTSGTAARFDATEKQYFEIADSADLDHEAGTTLSFYFLNLHEPDDRSFHGIAAKRDPKNQNRTNYGLNYQPSSKKLQVYINDGSGFRVVAFPLEESFGVRRLVHLTATFRPGDIPDPASDGEADGETDGDAGGAADDLEIRLFVNGQPLKPMEAPGVTVTDDSGWITGVDFAGLLNDAPLTIGASYPDGETISGLIDEFLVFNRPLSTEEVATLFREVAGPDGEELARREIEGTPSSSPVVSIVIPGGLQIGTLNRITIHGQNLSEATLSLVGTDVGISITESTANRLVADVAIPAETLPTVLPLIVVSPRGTSTSVPLPVDRLPQRIMPAADSDEPVELPAAFTGILEGSDLQRLAFDGRKGQTFVAEVELKRCGGQADAVLELKSESGVPVEIAWGRSIRGDDPRLVATLPHDGRYSLELHDLAWQAPSSPFRLLAGDLRLLDAVVPASVETGTTHAATPIGVGIEEMSLELTTISGKPTARLSGSAVTAAHGVLPVVPVETVRVLTEQDAAAQEAVDVSSEAVCIAGRLVEPGEIDRFQFRTTPGKRLVIQVEARAIGSPVEPVVTVFQGDRQINRKSAQPGTGGVSLAVTPEDAGGPVEVRIGDRLADVAGVARPYRLRLFRADVPHLDVTLRDSTVVLPSSGRGVLRFHIERRGPIQAIRLIPDEASGIVLEPELITLDQASEEVFVTVSAMPGREPERLVSLTAEAETEHGTLRRPVRMTPGDAVARYEATRPQFQAPIVMTSAAPTVELAGVPDSVFKGTTHTIALTIGGEVPDGYAVRFSLVSDEQPRPVEPNRPAAGEKPLVRLSDDAVVPPGDRAVDATLHIPADVAADEIRAVVKADVVPHPWSNHVIATGYSQAVSFMVQDAISVAEMESPSLSAGENHLAISMQRAAGFEEALKVELRGLPNGYAAAAVTVPAEQSAATLKIVVPDGTDSGPIPNVELAILDARGNVLKTIKPFTLTVQP